MYVDDVLAARQPISIRLEVDPQRNNTGKKEEKTEPILRLGASRPEQ